MHIHINIGSNIGDRAAHIERAVALIAARIDPECKAEITLAPIVHSLPAGFESSNDFLNLGLMIDTQETLDPFDILHKLQQIEREISTVPHRNADGSYCDREIDIDLIAIDDLVVETPELTLPHPRLGERPFVFEPLKYLDPDWKHPLKTKRQTVLSDIIH